MCVCAGWAGTHLFHLFTDYFWTCGWSKTLSPAPPALFTKRQKPQLTVAEGFIRIVLAVVLPVAPGGVSHTAAVDAAPVALLAHTVGWETKKQAEGPNYKSQTNNKLGCRSTGRKKTQQTWAGLTAVGLLLIWLVLAVGHAVTRQGVVDAVAVSTLKLIDDIARRVGGCETHRSKSEKQKQKHDHCIAVEIGLWWVKYLWAVCYAFTNMKIVRQTKFYTLDL